MTEQSEIGIKETIDSLIKTATNFDIDQLEVIYHNDLKVIMIDATGQKMISNNKCLKIYFNLNEIMAMLL